MREVMRKHVLCSDNSTLTWMEAAWLLSPDDIEIRTVQKNKLQIKETKMYSRPTETDNITSDEEYNFKTRPVSKFSFA